MLKLIYFYIVKNAIAFDPQAQAQQLSNNLNLKLSLLKDGSLDSHHAAIFTAQGDLDTVRVQLKNLKLDYDLWVLDRLIDLNSQGLIVLDMDMTSVQIEGIDEIARALGVFDQVAAITHLAMAGQLDFTQSLQRRVALLKNGNAEVLNKVRAIMHETDGLDTLMHIGQRYHFIRGICSGGFIQLIDVLEHKYQLERVIANSLEIEDGKFTGKVDRTVVDAKAKEQGVIAMQQEFGITKEQTIVLGDGANDLLMLKQAYLGIAYHAKPVVQQQAHFALNHSSLKAVTLFLMLGQQCHG